MIQGYAAFQAKDQLKPHSYEPQPLGPHDVEIKITHCGICHSDIHLIDNDWAISNYPFIPGHEIIGSVVKTGSEGTLKPGTMVGVGWQAGSCMECDACTSGHENWCQKSKATCVGRNGGYADSIIVDSRFAFPIPDTLSPEKTAPLLCGGITVYTPLKKYASKGKKVGIIGIGGLGHLAIQFAHAMGCDVTAFSTSPDKKGEAEKLGAHQFIVSTDAKQMEGLAQTFDLILSCVTADLDWNAYINLLAPAGTLAFVGASTAPLKVAPMQLIIGAKQLAGSDIGNRQAIQEMLDFAAEHKIGAITEVMPMKDVNSALDKVRKNKARYRVVLKN